MEIRNLWTGNNTTEDISGTSNLSWVGTPEYQSSAFRFTTSGETMLNYLEFPDFVITSGTPFAFEGEVFAENFDSFPHISTPETGLGQGDNQGISFFFDFDEGFSQVKVNNSGYVSWRYIVTSASVMSWHTWRLEYDGVETWKLIINGIKVPVYETYGDLHFNGLKESPHIYVSNWEDFGDSYFLLKDLKFYM